MNSEHPPPRLSPTLNFDQNGEQIPQGVPFNPQIPGSQFMGAEPSQRSQQAIATNVNPQPLTQQNERVLKEMTDRLLSQFSEEQKMAIRMRVWERLESINPRVLRIYQAAGVDLVYKYFQNQAQLQLRQNQQMTAIGLPMQQKRSMNPSLSNRQSQLPTTSGGNLDFSSLIGDMGDLAAQQQQQGVMTQEADPMGFPASGVPRWSSRISAPQSDANIITAMPRPSWSTKPKHALSGWD